MKFSLLSLSAVVALSLVSALPTGIPITYDGPVESFSDHRVIRIQVKDEAALKALTDNEDALSLDYFTHNKVVGAHVDVRISPKSFETFKGLNLEYETLIDNLQVLVEAENNENKQYQLSFQKSLLENKNKFSTLADSYAAAAADTWFQGYHSFAEHQSWLQSQIANNAGKASAISAGQSSQGRSQNGIKIGNGPNHLLVGTDSRVNGYLSKFTFHIIPVMNPDGFVISQTSNRMHRKNAQVNGGCTGTDTNRNWSFKWGTGGSSSNPCADDYKGPSAFSAPEARNIGNYLTSLPKVVSYIDFHSYSQLWMVPFGYTGTRPSNYAYLNGLAQSAAKALKAVNGVSFRTGDIYNTIYQASGNSADYAYSVGVGAPFAVEL
ncbi:hypothetical protein BGW38_001107, partial [Lunasporangiospora selenospora]